jgi:uncharacterized damage-inducible protein DinB
MTSRIATLHRLFDHLAWADAELARAIGLGDPNAEALREFAHIAGAEEVWLSRIEGRPSAAKVWPGFSRAEAVALVAKSAAGYKRLLDDATESALDEPVDYTNSAGQRFSTPLVDILLQVALHGQYHRGKVNLLLRQAGAEPAPTDFISFARGVPAAVTPR